MGNFNRDRKSVGGRDFKRRDFGNRDSDRPQMMHKTICSSCGKECEVPFKPNGSRPVFCRDCFQKNRSSDSIRSDNNYPRRSNFEDRGNSQINRPVEQPQYREQFEALSAKLDKILKILTPVAFGKETPAVQEEQPIIPEKKKRVSKKAPLTPKE